jgi:CBS domain-containing protein
METEAPSLIFKFQRRNKMALHAKDLMRKKAVVRTDASVKEAAHKMISTGLPGLPVVNDRMEAIGVVTEFNVLGAIREGMDLEKTAAARIMTPQPITADANTSCHELIQIMLVNNYTVLPIVKNGKCVGVVSRLSVMDANLSPRYYSISSGREHSDALIFV